MTPPRESSDIKKINSLLITSLALIILGGVLLLLGASLQEPIYDRWGLTGERIIAGSIGMTGLILMLVGPILTIIRFKWLAETSRSIIAGDSVVIGPVTKYLAFASFSIGYLLGLFFVFIPFRSGFSSGLWILLIPAVPLSIHAEFIRRTILVVIQHQRQPRPLPQEQITEQPGVPETLPGKTPPDKITPPIREKKVLSQPAGFTEQKHGWLDRPIHPSLPAITNEVAIFVLIILAALVTRFFDLGSRVMSHDESLHTYFSYLLSRGQGYQHSPMMHGPFQFHIIGLTYYLFGDNDFTSRIPSALFSIATIWMVWYWRRYLGRAGALIGGVLLVISPYMLYYGRYVRNESFAGFSGILMLYVILRYLEAGEKKYLYLLSAALVLHFTSKETSFIYAAQALLYLAFYFIARVTRLPWAYREHKYRAFIISLVVALLLMTGALAFGMANRETNVLGPTETAAPANPLGDAPPLTAPEGGFSVSTIVTLALVAGALIALVFAAYFLITGYTWERLLAERSFDLLIVTGTLVLPNLTAFVLSALQKVSERLGWGLNVAIPSTDAEVRALSGDPAAIIIIAIALALMFGLSILIGLLWNRDAWWKVAAVFWGPFTILYTTVFTNSAGFITGVLGSLGYWLVQQGVERGSQPWYFYILIQIPIYEFLPALGLILALFLGLRRKIRKVPEPVTTTDPAQDEPVDVEPLTTEEGNFRNTFSLLVWWSISSVAAFSYAGEKMPWLTYHLTLPMILATGWAIDHMVGAIDWDGLKRRRAGIVITLMPVFATSLVLSLLSLYGPNPPFQGKELIQLQATGNFLLPALAAIASAAGLAYLLNDWDIRQILRILALTVFALLATLTMRASFRAAYITYDQATEYLVYAHGAAGIKQVMAQAQEISQRTTGGMDMLIAYDASAPDTGVSWPFVWYLREYPNLRSFDVPTRSLRDAPFVVVDQKNFDKIETALGPGYYRFDYIRMWWPNQDYFGLTCRPPQANLNLETGEYIENPGLLLRLGAFFDFPNWNCDRLRNALLDRNLRAGIWEIWLDRDYTRYAQAVAPYNPYFDPGSYTLKGWSPADQMRLYIRQDVAAQIWNYGIGPVGSLAQADPYEENTIILAADLIVDSGALQTTAMNAPRGLAFAPDGTFYVADSRNHRVLHFSAEGGLLGQWGAFGDGVNLPNPIGTFNEPWGIAVAPDGTVYVSDTWNHRVQHFTSEGNPINMWGYYGQGEAPEAFWGPRGLAVDAQGHVYVADTGNKRIVVFDARGKYITQFGSAGLDPGQFDEPVGVAVVADGTVYVTDTWNQRIQAFVPAMDGTFFAPFLQWDVNAWSGQSLDNKPLIAVNAEGHIFITDPEGFRILEFDANGIFVRAWGDFGSDATQFGMAGGVAVDAQGHVWVADAGNQRIMRFTLP